MSSSNATAPGAADGFTLCSLNCNGLRAAAARGFERWLSRSRPDVLCLQELRAWPEQVPPALHTPRGYHTEWITAEKRGYSGVGIYAREQPLQTHVGTGLDWSDREGRAVRADFEHLSVYSLYVPSGSSGEVRQAAKFRYMEHFLGWAAERLAERRPMALCGDFNVAHTELDIHDPRGNAMNSGYLPRERAWFTRLLAQGWIDVVRERNGFAPDLYSWWSNRGRARELNRGWRIDYVLASPAFDERVREAWIEQDAGLSDHAPVWVRFE